MEQDVAKRPTLSNELRERTAALHTEAERSGIVNDILRKQADRRGYAMLLRNLLPAYVKLERALERPRASQALDVFAEPALRRAPRIAADLESLSGPRWEWDLPLLPAGQAYADAVAMAGAGNGAGLMAHAYVRYFGDLSGGQVLKRLLGQSLGIGPDALSLYEFPGLDPVDAKNRMRDAIDTGVADTDRDTVIVEAMRAFQHNIDVSRAIQSLVAPAA
jgi:heme oxygenase